MADVHHPAPEWLEDLLGVAALQEDSEFEVRRHRFVVRNAIPRSQKLISSAQGQTRDTFSFKWKKRDTFESAASLARMRTWLNERYGDAGASSWLSEYGEFPILLDAGCGAAMSAIELWGDTIRRVRYLGVDVSEAVDVARQRFADRGLPGGFLQADISELPLEDQSIDLIFSEGVLHHTNSTEQTLKALARLLKPGGRVLFYVYRRKGPVREFTDDYIRAKMQSMPPEDAWAAIQSLTRLGISLGELNAEIDIPEPVDLMGIPAGRTSVQRLFYWHVAKVFYHPELTLEEMNHINFDWYAPANAHRQTPDEVKRWCAEAGLQVEREVVEDAGITVIARKAY